MAGPAGCEPIPTPISPALYGPALREGMRVRPNDGQCCARFVLAAVDLVSVPSACVNAGTNLD